MIFMQNLLQPGTAKVQFEEKDNSFFHRARALKKVIDVHFVSNTDLYAFRLEEVAFTCFPRRFCHSIIYHSLAIALHSIRNPVMHSS